MIIFLYLSGRTISGYEIRPEMPSSHPTGTASITMDNVPEDFFESPSDYEHNGQSGLQDGRALSLIEGRTPTKRFQTIDSLDTTTKNKVNATPWARTKLVKTTTFKFL